MSSIIRTKPETGAEVQYPSSDGVPVGETDWHIWALILLREALEDVFADQENVYVASDMFLYYRKDYPKANKAPDAMVVKGVAKHFRRSFQTWVENAIPCVIVEIASEKTWKKDLGSKRKLYERLGVFEYFVFDPEALYLDPPLQGFRRQGKKYVPVVPMTDGGLFCQELGLHLIAEDHMLRLREARTGQLIPTRQERAEEAQRQAEQEKQRAEQEKQRADALAAELAQLRAAQPQRKSKKKER